MGYLKSKPDVFLDTCPCYAHAQRTEAGHSQGPNRRKRRAAETPGHCLTPVGRRRLQLASGGRKSLDAACAGTTCTDVSQMGLRRSLTGSSCMPLALWLVERWFTEELVIGHECTCGFDREGVLLKHLPQYKWVWPTIEKGSFPLSPCHFGWPCTRDRSYTVGGPGAS